jgi:hypothetical protein
MFLAMGWRDEHCQDFALGFEVRQWHRRVEAAGDWGTGLWRDLAHPDRAKRAMSQNNA